MPNPIGPSIYFRGQQTFFPGKDQARLNHDVCLDLCNYSPFRRVVQSHKLNPDLIELNFEEDLGNLYITLWEPSQPGYTPRLLITPGDGPIWDAARYLLNPSTPRPQFPHPPAPPTPPLPNAETQQRPGPVPTHAPVQNDRLLKTFAKIFKEQSKQAKEHRKAIEALSHAIRNQGPAAFSPPPPNQDNTELNELQRKLQQMQADRDNLQQKVQTQQKAIDDEAAFYDKKLEEHTAKQNELSAELLQKEETIQKLEQGRDRLNETIGWGKTELERLENERDWLDESLEIKKKELTEVTERLECVGKEKNDLEEKLKLAGESSDQLKTQHQAEIRNLTEQHQLGLGQSEDRLIELQQELTEKENVVLEIAEQAQQMQAERDGLQAEISKLTEQHQLGLGQSEDRLIELQQELTEKENVVLEIAEQAQQMQAERDGLQAEISKLTEQHQLELGQSEARLAELQKELDEAKCINQQVDQISAENERLAKEQRNLQDELSQMQELHNQDVSDNKSLEARIHEQNQAYLRLADLPSKRLELSTRLLDKEFEIHQLKLQLEQRQNAQEMNALLEIRDLKMQSKHAQVEISDLRNEIVRLRNVNEEITRKQESERAAQIYNDWEEQARQDQISELETRLEYLQQELGAKKMSILPDSELNEQKYNTPPVTARQFTFQVPAQGSSQKESELEAMLEAQAIAIEKLLTNRIESEAAIVALNDKMDAGFEEDRPEIECSDKLALKIQQNALLAESNAALEEDQKNIEDTDQIIKNFYATHPKKKKEPNSSFPKF